MKSLLVLFFVTVLFNSVNLTNCSVNHAITCSDMKGITLLGSFAISVSSSGYKDVPISLYLSTNARRYSVKISASDWTGIYSHEFNPSKKTVFVIHGYKSGGQKKWVLELKEKLLDVVDANVILVDWSSGSNSKNYVDAARNTIIAANHIFNFLQQLRPVVEDLKPNSSEILWNHLYFIGHSLGAQISGQLSNLLKENNFWVIERITGLDPAKPCFVNLDAQLRLGTEDANFVDIIHTQTGNGGTTDGLGLLEKIGHIDFYVNTGVVQPECLGTKFTPRWTTMICSHKASYKYFTESLIHSSGGSCKFASYPWDGSYDDAQNILYSQLNGGTCADCPELGINAVKSSRRGGFLVITAEKEPHCRFQNSDLKKILKVIGRLKHRIAGRRFNDSSEVQE